MTCFTTLPTYITVLSWGLRHYSLRQNNKACNGNVTIHWCVENEIQLFLFTGCNLLQNMLNFSVIFCKPQHNLPTSDLWENLHVMQKISNFGLYYLNCHVPQDWCSNILPICFTLFPPCTQCLQLWHEETNISVWIWVLNIQSHPPTNKPVGILSNVSNIVSTWTTHMSQIYQVASKGHLL